MCCVEMTSTVIIAIWGTKWSKYSPNLAYKTRRRIKIQQKMFHREIPCLCQKVSIEVSFAVCVGDKYPQKIESKICNHKLNYYSLANLTT